MAKIPTTGAGEFQLRPSTDLFGGKGWGGVNTEDDPISLGPNELQRGQNLRRHGKGLKSRPGLSLKISLSTVAGFTAGGVMWMKEVAGAAAAPNLWAACGGTDPSTPGSSVLRIDSLASTPVYRYVAMADANEIIAPVGSYLGNLYMGFGNTLYLVSIFPVFSGSDVGYRIPTNTIIPVARIGTDPTTYSISCIQEFNGMLFVGATNNSTPGSSKVMVLQGGALVDDLTSIYPPRAFGIWRNKLVVGIGSTSTNIQLRDEGSTIPGTWASKSLAGFTCTVCGSIQEYGPDLYIAGGKDTIYKYDGTNLTSVRTITGCSTVADEGVNCLALHNGILYYGWNTASTYNTRLGRFDLDSTGNAWVDTYKDVTADAANFTRIKSLASFRRQLYLGGGKQYIVTTAPNDVKGTIQALNGSGATTNAKYVYQFLRL